MSSRQGDTASVPGAGIDLLEHRIRPAASDPEGALVLLHGRGTDENDLFGLLDALDPDRRLIGITPRAPLSLPPGGYHWYVVPRVGYPDPDTFLQAYSLLSAWLDSLPAQLGVPWNKTVLGGFSMGAVMSYALGLGPERPAPAGICAMSGFIPTVPNFALDLEGRHGYPVAIAHGSLDPIIEVGFAHDARARLEGAGCDVLYRESEIGHSVDPALLPLLEGWVKQRLAP
jgi:phospholipase/carboxylesterase